MSEPKNEAGKCEGYCHNTHAALVAANPNLKDAIKAAIGAGIPFSQILAFITTLLANAPQLLTDAQAIYQKVMEWINKLKPTPPAPPA